MKTTSKIEAHPTGSGLTARSSCRGFGIVFDDPAIFTSIRTAENIPDSDITRLQMTAIILLRYRPEPIPTSGWSFGDTGMSPSMHPSLSKSSRNVSAILESNAFGKRVLYPFRFISRLRCCLSRSPRALAQPLSAQVNGQAK